MSMVCYSLKRRKHTTEGRKQHSHRNGLDLKKENTRTSGPQKTDGRDSIDSFCVPEWHVVLTLTIYKPTDN